MELGICRGKKTYDKRQDMIARDAKREIEMRMKEQSINHGGEPVSTGLLKQDKRVEDSRWYSLKNENLKINC